MRVHIVKREDCPLLKKILLIVGAVALALVLGGLVLLAMGVNPLEYYFKMFTMGMVGNKIAYKAAENYLKILVPLILTALGLSLAFKMRFWNIGGEGQFIVGAIAAAAVAFTAGPVLPTPVVLLMMCLAAMLAAGLLGLFVAALKVKFGTNETLLTLMLNYIALYFLTFLGETKADWNFFLSAESARPTFASFGVLVYVYLKRTKQGYEIAVVGDSMGTARYAGMKVSTIVLRTVFLSACLIGLAAAFKVGTAGILSASITDDVGWTGIIVAWLAKLSTVGIFLVSALIGVLQYGSTAAAATFASVDSSFADMLQGVILFLVLAADFFTRFRVVIAKKEVERHG